MPMYDGAVGLLASLTPAERVLLSRAGRELTYAEGVRLFDEGGQANGCWLIRSGRVALDTEIPGRGLVTIETLGAGDILGWSWLVPPHRWHFGARVLEQLHATVLDTVQLRALAEEEPRFGYALTRQLFQALLDRLQATRARMLDLYRSPDEPMR